MALSRCAAFVLACALLAPVHADPPPALSEYGDTYTPEELAALDRILHAGNMNRADLTFRKDMAKGHACLPLVRELLRDPLLIARKMDEAVVGLSPATFGEFKPLGPGPHAKAMAPLLALLIALDVYRNEVVTSALADVSRASLMGLVQPLRPPLQTATPDERALERLGRAVSTGVILFGEEPSVTGEAAELRKNVLRSRLPDEMLMRGVFPSPFDAVTQASVKDRSAGRSPAALFEDALALFSTTDGGLPHSAAPFAALFDVLFDAWPSSSFPTDRPMVKETPHGRIALGTTGSDTYTGDFAAIVDPGGNDRYENGRFASAFGVENRRVGFLLDLGGDDVYDCGGVDCTLGAAILGVAALVDLGRGNDRYVGGHLSLGAAVGGIAMLYDDGGSDTYEGRTFTQGAAGFGIGILYDDAVGEPPAQKTDEETKDPVEIARWDNDRLSAWCCAQAFARTKGVALCINTRGNEVYEAGGVYLHAPLFADRYQSFSQGFAIGAREIDYAGGLAMLIDRAGNDRYLGDIYNQGVGYWYSAGLLWDGGGNDVYEMTQYGQGSGIHLAVGGLVDVSGSDAYLMHSGLGQGGSHDFAASVLHDRGGNDRYHGNTSCNGCGLTNSVGLFLDRSGDDTYAARRDGGLNAGRPARGFGSVGLFVDLGGKDDYLGPQRDEAQWRDSDVGLGIDVATPLQGPGGAGGTSEPNQLTGKAEVPPVVRHEGPLTQAVFDELWAIAIRWEVGDNRVIVPEARKRLVAFGPDVLPMLDGKLGDNDTGLALRAYVDVLKALSAAGAGPRVVELLRTNTRADSEQRRKSALQLIGELKVTEAEDAVVALLEGPDDALARRAAGVLLMLGSHAGDERLETWLASDDERRVLAALGTLLGLDADVYPLVRPLLDHPMVSVRTRLATLLADRRATYGKAILDDLLTRDPLLGDRGLRALLDAVARGPIPPTAPAVAHLTSLLGATDWALRADAVRVLRAWLNAKDADAALLKPAADALAALRTAEKDPFVLAQLK